MTQRQEFRVIQKYKSFEVREYEPCVLAEVRISAQYSEATGTAFGHLFRYISKGNRTEENCYDCSSNCGSESRQGT